MQTFVSILLFVSFSCALDFGTIYKNSSIIVKFINEDDVRSYQQRERESLVEQKWYIGGKRISGDGLIANNRDQFDFGSTKDFYIELRYPEQKDFYITHISCLVEQSSLIGRAYTTDGGIGKNYMTLVIESKRTEYFYYNVYLFGRKFS